MNIQKLEQILKDNNQPKFRLEQIQKAIYQYGVSSFSEITTISKDLREILEKEMKILSFEVEKVLISDDKRSVKALLKIPVCHSERSVAKSKNLSPDPSTSVGMTEYDCIETVLLSPRKDTWTACISSQVGCPLGCAFCATGKGGFKRNLTTEEITDQILFWKQYLKLRTTNQELRTENNVSNIVFMGMGEPFLNWEEVKKSLEDLINPKIFGFGARSISVSTSGIPEGIEIFTKTFPQMNLAVSLHFAENEMRSRYMPINKQYDLEKIRETLKKYFQKSKRKIFIEYILFQGLNDNLQDARKVSEYLKSIGHGYLLHVNLISYNAEYETTDEFKASSRNNTIKFKNCLEQNHISVTIRKSLGEEIQGACGQLAGKQ